jgi:hypothetical protein
MNTLVFLAGMGAGILVVAIITFAFIVLNRRIAAAALAPDREKLTAYVAAVRALVVPALSSDAGKAIEANLVQRREAYCAYLERTATTL